MVQSRRSFGLFIYKQTCNKDEKFNHEIYYCNEILQQNIIDFNHEYHRPN
jgi:hypothetical protein